MQLPSNFSKLIIGITAGRLAGNQMSLLVVAGIVVVFIGALGALMAKRFPAHSKPIEICSGYLLIVGFAAAGACLPVVL
jgi:hypothetical protein